LIEDGTVVAAGLVGERASEPTLADTGRAAQDDVVVSIDKAAVGKLEEQRAIKAPRGAVIDIFDGGVMAQPGIAQAREQPSVAAIGDFAIEQQAEPFGMRQGRGLTGSFDLAEGFGHAVEAEFMHQLERWMGQHV
jgi:hypothetical protein